MHAEPLSWWTSEVTEFAPVGHVLRRHLRDKWTRFHSLPESRRYAEDESDYVELLTRHLSVASELFEIGEPIYVYRSQFSERTLNGRHRHQIAGRQLRGNMVQLPSDPHTKDEENNYYYIRALATHWIPDFFEELTRQVADGKETGITFISPSTKNIYSPYDGGMNVFLFSKSRSALEAKFPSWMSDREDRL